MHAPGGEWTPRQLVYSKLIRASCPQRELELNSPAWSKHWALALELYTVCLSAQRKSLQRIEHPDVARTLGAMGALHAIAGDWRSAANCYGQCLEIQRKCLGARAGVCAVTMDGLASACIAAGRTRSAADVTALFAAAKCALSTWRGDATAAAQCAPPHGAVAVIPGGSVGDPSCEETLPEIALALFDISEDIARSVFGDAHRFVSLIKDHRENATAGSS